jgi:hypothetical protein
MATAAVAAGVPGGNDSECAIVAILPHGAMMRRGSSSLTGDVIERTARLRRLARLVSGGHRRLMVWISRN